MLVWEGVLLRLPPFHGDYKMGCKKKEPELVIHNEYGIIYNGSFLDASFTHHKKTNTYRLNRPTLATVTLASYNRILSTMIPGNAYTYVENRIKEVKENTRLLLFATPLIAKLWLISCSSYPGSKDTAFLFSEQEANRIIKKHKYYLRHSAFGVSESGNDISTLPLLCEFEVVKV